MDARDALETGPVSISPAKPPAEGLATSLATSPAPDARRWEIVDGLLVLSRPEGAGGARERLVPTLAPCPHPGCVCDTLHLRMFDRAGPADGRRRVGRGRGRRVRRPRQLRLRSGRLFGEQRPVRVVASSVVQCAFRYSTLAL